MEWTGEKAESIARNIFEQVGMVKFAGESGFVIAYVDFLIGMLTEMVVVYLNDGVVVGFGCVVAVHGGYG